MTVLGIESATAVCGVAIVADGVVLADSRIVQKNVHAEKLLTLVDDVLRKSGQTMSGVSGIAISIGPGSFTGLRIGLSVAKGLSYATGIPLVAVPTLEALAETLVQSMHGEEPRHILAMIDARRDEVYCQLFRLAEGTVVKVWEEKDRALDEVLADLKDLPVMVTGDANEKLAALLQVAATGKTESIRFADPEAARCSAATVALIGERLLRDGRTEDLAVLEPRYIKEFFFKSR